MSVATAAKGKITRTVTFRAMPVSEGRAPKVEKPFADAPGELPFVVIRETLAEHEDGRKSYRKEVMAFCGNEERARKIAVALGLVNSQFNPL